MAVASISVSLTRKIGTEMLLNVRLFLCRESKAVEDRPLLDFSCLSTLFAVNRIHVNRRDSPAFSSDVPRPAKCDRCPAFLENGIIIFFVADYATFLPRNATK